MCKKSVIGIFFSFFFFKRETDFERKHEQCLFLSPFVSTKEIHGLTSTLIRLRYDALTVIGVNC